MIWWILETVYNLAVEIQQNLRSDDHINYIMFPLLLHLSNLTKNMTFLWYLQIFRNLNWFKLISCLFVNLSSLCVETLNLHSWLYQQIKKKVLRQKFCHYYVLIKFHQVWDNCWILLGVEYLADLHLIVYTIVSHFINLVNRRYIFWFL